LSDTAQHLERFRCQGFRNLQPLQLEFDSGIHGFFGANGQGKSNLLEGLYTLLAGRSFRTQQLSDCLQQGQQAFQLEGLLVSPVRQSRLEWHYRQGKSQKLLDGKAVSTRDYLACAPVLAFHARSRMLLEGSPEERRRFLDRLVFCLEPCHLDDLKKMQRLLEQLKAILASDPRPALLRPFKLPFARLSHAIAERRRSFLGQLTPFLLDMLRQIFSWSVLVELRYLMRQRVEPQDYLDKMERIMANECLARRLQMGAHLDDFELILDGRPSRQVASAGQQRLLLLALLCGTLVARKQTKSSGIIFVFDDFDSELDYEKIESFCSWIQPRTQTFISSAKRDIIASKWMSRAFTLHQGAVRLERNNG
jgi:DNA replication and repair protein RecF